MKSISEVTSMITRLLSILLLFLSIQTFGQDKHCFCELNSLMNNGAISCDTLSLKNNSIIYWQYNCDSIWLTLEHINGNKVIIDNVPVELYGYAYRLGFELIKEFDNALLFRNGCSANGPCSYSLLDKNNGRLKREFDQLICIDTDMNQEDPHAYDLDFVVYLADSTDDLIIFYVNSGKTLEVPFKQKLTSPIPQQQFEKMSLENNILTLVYELDNKNNQTFKIDLDNQKYITGQ